MHIGLNQRSYLRNILGKIYPDTDGEKLWGMTELEEKDYKYLLALFFQKKTDEFKQHISNLQKHVAPSKY